MELSNLHLVALWAFLLGMVFGAVANKTQFCAMGGISDWINMGSKGRLGAWFLAIGVAIVGSQALDLAALIDLNSAIYRSPNFRWLSYVTGGLLFGIGMTLGSGCGQRNLVRLGGGNLKALVVLLVMGITAYATLRGLLALLRTDYIDSQNIDLTAYGLQDQGLVSIVVSWAGLTDHFVAQAIIALSIGLGFMVFALKQETLRNSFDNLLAGITIGICAVAAWYITGVVGSDDFDPVPLQGVTFVSPVAHTVQYVMTYTGSTINFGIALVLGMVLGSFVYAVLSGNFRIETFRDRGDMVGSLTGGVLMGFGGVLALGCTIGQGVTGMSTLAAGSVIALVSIIFGSVITMKTQHHLLDGKDFFPALKAAFRGPKPSRPAP